MYSQSNLEIEATKLDLLPSVIVSVPRVAQSAWAMECRLHSTMQIGVRRAAGSATIVVGEIVAMHILNLESLQRTKEWDPIARLHGSWYSRIGEMFSLNRPVYDASKKREK
jgi:flavin reductase (DIM6/NTAB) family NADH-FMN oxidoreductase RutF